MLTWIRPRAVWQLVLLAFAIVVTPIGTLLYSTTLSLQALHTNSRQLTDEATSLASDSRGAESALIDLERATRQYVVIKDSALIATYQTTAKELVEQVSRIASILRNEHASNLAASLHLHQEQLFNALRSMDKTGGSTEASSRLRLLEVMQTTLEELLGMARRYSQRQSLELSNATTEVREQVITSALILVPATLFLIILFTILIVRPISKLRNAIRALGTELHSPLRLDGPQELVTLANELNHLAHRLDQVDEQKQQFLRHISHELKTPLASILEGASLLQDELVGQLNRPQQEVVDLVAESGHQLQELIDNLLAYNRLHHKGSGEARADGTIGESGFPLLDIAARLLRRHSLGMGHTGQHLCIGGDEPTLDERQLAFLKDPRLVTTLDNLLSNAIAYGAAGGRIWFTWHYKSDCLSISLRNTGDNIPDDEAPHIFDPFYQGSIKRSGAVKGSGIGLSVARESILALGGELGLCNTTKGTVEFQITLPLS